MGLSGNTRTNTYQVSQSGSTINYTYDANGNLTSDGTRTYEWDAASRLLRVAQGATELVRFTYDGLGRRSQKIAGGVTRTYVYDGSDIIEERLSTGAALRHVYGLGVDQPLARRDNADAVTYYLVDHLGSVVLETNASGAASLTREYDPFGNLLQGSSVSGYAFTGRDLDAESGLLYYRERYYSPSVGRFISEDPIGFADGPNTYAYVRNGPLTGRDPFGLTRQDCVDAAMARFVECVAGIQKGEVTLMRICEQQCDSEPPLTKLKRRLGILPDCFNECMVDKYKWLRELAAKCKADFEKEIKACPPDPWWVPGPPNPFSPPPAKKC